MDAAHRLPCLFYSAKENFHSSRVQPPAYPVVIPMVCFLPPCRLQCRPHGPAAEWRTFPPPAEWRTSAANSQFVYIALIFSSQGLWYTIGTVKMTATSSLYMIPPHTKIKP